jgi:hypothetical protein
MSKYYEDSDGKRYEEKEHLFGGKYYEDSDGKTYEVKEHLLGGKYIEDSDGKTYEVKEHLFGGEYIEDSDGKSYEEKEHLFGGKYYEDSDGKTYEKKESICFISTACIEVMGRPDDCEELMMLRQFREDHLVGKPIGEAILFEYKEISRTILSWIERQKNRAALYRDLYNRLVLGSVILIKEGKTDQAIEHYRRIVAEYKIAAGK